MRKQQSEELSGFVHLVERQMLLYEERRKLVRQGPEEKAPGPYRFITISRDTGSWGDFVASELAQRLNWKVYDKEIVDYIATNSNVRHRLVDQLDEKAQTLIHDTINRLLKMFEGQAFSNEEYGFALLKTLAALAAQGKAIILGHGGAFALQEQPGLHLRITASLPVRVERMNKRWGLSTEETRRRILKVDAERRSFIQYHFKLEREDIRFFHMVFNTDHSSIDEVVAATLSVMERSARANVPVPGPAAFESLTFRSSEGAPRLPQR